MDSHPTNVVPNTQRATRRAWANSLALGIVVLPCLLFLVSVVLSSPHVSACPACKDMLIEPNQLKQRLGLARGFALSIGLMLSIPVGLVGAVTTAVIHTTRRAKSSTVVGEASRGTQHVSSV